VELSPHDERCAPLQLAAREWAQRGVGPRLRRTDVMTVSVRSDCPTGVTAAGQALRWIKDNATESAG
jgi:hypothetical protein